MIITKARDLATSHTVLVTSSATLPVLSSRSTQSSVCNRCGEQVEEVSDEKVREMEEF